MSVFLGELRLFIRHDDTGDARGLYVHGFHPQSNAEKQGTVLAGDEILAINGINIQGGQLEDVVRALSFGDPGDLFAPFIVRRHVQISGGTLLADDDDDDDGDESDDGDAKLLPAEEEEEEEVFDDDVPEESFVIKRITGSPLKVSLADVMANPDHSEMEFTIPKVGLLGCKRISNMIPYVHIPTPTLTRCLCNK